VLAKLQKGNKGLRISYTLPVSPDGISRDSQHLLTDSKVRAMQKWSKEHPWICSLSFWSGDRDSGRRRGGRNNVPATAPATAPAAEPWAYTNVFKQFTAR